MTARAGMTNNFHFRGRIPASKSILNRLLILRSFEYGLIIDGDSDADDVVKMKHALAQLDRGEMADCGHAGTTLRFLALRASRLPGTHHLAGSLRLFQRPQTEIIRILEQLGCQADVGPQRLTIRGQGWNVPDQGLKIDRSISSQFASAVLLSAWDLPKPLALRFEGEAVSEPYFAMTLELARQAGMRFEVVSPKEVVVAAGSRVTPQIFLAETDISSAFSVAALAALRGVAEFQAWPDRSLQPDSVFPEILEKMGCRVAFVEELGHNHLSHLKTLRIERPVGDLKPVNWDLRDCPDLFPVLAALCAFAEGRSRLFGAPQLAHKESSRIEKSAELVRLAGRKAREIEGGLEIDGSSATSEHSDMKDNRLPFDTDHDHRLAMAAAVVRAAGIPIRILHPEVINKSFPAFFSVAASVVGQDKGEAR